MSAAKTASSQSKAGATAGQSRNAWVRESSCPGLPAAAQCWQQASVGSRTAGLRRKRRAPVMRAPWRMRQAVATCWRCRVGSASSAHTALQAVVGEGNAGPPAGTAASGGGGAGAGGGSGAGAGAGGAGRGSPTPGGAPTWGCRGRGGGRGAPPRLPTIQMGGSSPARNPAGRPPAATRCSSAAASARRRCSCARVVAQAASMVVMPVESQAAGGPPAAGSGGRAPQRRGQIPERRT